VNKGQHSPFPRRTRFDDNGEMAASDEQGGSSDRSGSLGPGLAHYSGGGIITVSQEILNSTQDLNEEQTTL